MALASCSGAVDLILRLCLHRNCIQGGCYLAHDLLGLVVAVTAEVHSPAFGARKSLVESQVGELVAGTASSGGGVGWRGVAAHQRLLMMLQSVKEADLAAFFIARVSGGLGN